MRYELQYSFEEIADALKLKSNQVKKIFVQAHAVVRKAKKSDIERKKNYGKETNNADRENSGFYRRAIR